MNPKYILTINRNNFLVFCKLLSADKCTVVIICPVKRYIRSQENKNSLFINIEIGDRKRGKNMNNVHIHRQSLGIIIQNFPFVNSTTI